MLQALWPNPYSFLATSNIPKLIYQAPMTELTKTLIQNLINQLNPKKKKKNLEQKLIADKFNAKNMEADKFKFVSFQVSCHFVENIEPL
jgi:hypothetical protein